MWGVHTALPHLLAFRIGHPFHPSMTHSDKGLLHYWIQMDPFSLCFYHYSEGVHRTRYLSSVQVRAPEAPGNSSQELYYSWTFPFEGTMHLGEGGVQCVCVSMCEMKSSTDKVFLTVGRISCINSCRSMHS